MRGNPKFGLNYSSGELQMEFTNFQLCRVWYGGFLSLENCCLEMIQQYITLLCFSHEPPKLSWVNDPSQIKSWMFSCPLLRVPFFYVFTAKVPLIWGPFSRLTVPLTRVLWLPVTDESLLGEIHPARAQSMGGVPLYVALPLLIKH